VWDMTIELSEDDFVRVLWAVQEYAKVMGVGIKKSTAEGTVTAEDHEAMRAMIALHGLLVQKGRDAGIIVKPS
jgi:hypothetical protein